jgi:hypothetical protein
LAMLLRHCLLFVKKRLQFLLVLEIQFIAVTLELLGQPTGDRVFSFFNRR